MSLPPPARGLACALLLAVVSVSAAADPYDHPGTGSERPDDADVSHVCLGELSFLRGAPAGRAFHRHNRITLHESSLRDGWVTLEQCHEHLAG